MTEEPRYKTITDTLAASVEYGDTRIKDFTTQSQDFLLRLVGPELQHYRTGAQTFLDLLAQNIPARAAYAHIMAAIPEHLRHEIQSWRQDLIDASQATIATLGWAENEETLAFCSVAAAALGTGFVRDPLYPWVQDLGGTQAQGNPQDRFDRVKLFASKRLRQQLSIMDKHYGI